MRYLAIDLGAKRIGFAVGDDQTRIASPLCVVTIATADQRLEQVGRLIHEQQPDALVLGLPLNMDGTEGPPAAQTRSLALSLQEQFGLTVHLVDERLTTHAANAQMAGLSLTHKKKKSKRDALAAATILRDFLESLSATHRHDRDDLDRLS